LCKFIIENPLGDIPKECPLDGINEIVFNILKEVDEQQGENND